MAPVVPMKSHRALGTAPSNKENHSVAIASKLHRYASSSASSSSNSPVPDLAALQLQHCPPLNNCHDPVSWTLEHSTDDECQAAEILTSIMTSQSNDSNTRHHDELNLIQSDSMDGHVDPVSCHLMQVDEDDEAGGIEGRDEISRHDGAASANHGYGIYQHLPQQQSPPAPRSFTPSDTVQRPQPYRLQLFPMPSASYSYDDE